MAAARRGVTLGLQAREQAKIKVRQPLAGVLISGPGAEQANRHAGIIAEELNVKAVGVAPSASVEEGWVSTADGGMTVAIDTRMTQELLAEGMARELSRAVQNLRKKSGLAVADRIHLGIEAPPEVSEAIEPHLAWLASETLATSTEHAAVADPEGKQDVTVDGLRITISLRRA